jgi:hypothetical protein
MGGLGLNWQALTTEDTKVHQGNLRNPKPLWNFVSFVVYGFIRASRNGATADGRAVAKPISFHGMLCLLVSVLKAQLPLQLQGQERKLLHQF